MNESTERPLVSVGMSVHNCADTVGTAIQSIINQSYSNWELILINDGSSDATDSICRLFSDSRIRYICDDQNIGLHYRLNQAIELSRGHYFARMDGDDVSLPSRLEIEAEYLMSHQEVDLVATPILVIDEINSVKGVRGHGMNHRAICACPWRGFTLAHPTWMGKLSWFRKFLYSDNAVRIEDQEILFRSYRTSRFIVLDEPLLAYRDIDLFSKRAALSRRALSGLLIKWFIKTRNPLFLVSGLSYGLLSINFIYHVLRRITKPRSTVMYAPSAQLIDTWLSSISEIESVVAHKTSTNNDQ